ncbi:hypothetical protein GV828_02755 [Flavobacterium sp. NST-5]|uniref:Uncharacterized protein n=1 Tax=Flavobacterium ichthyis TaxID=2698827 RepID=A0ABW9Z5J0_9FLAO|nr:hypothetical protein [Flavobacterium ichthyis]NBL64116.1 hypothetical protein [Flavobacterium ichthyis]
MKIEDSHLTIYPFYEANQSQGLVVLFDEFVFLPVTLENLNYVIENQLKPALRPIGDLTNFFLDHNLEDHNIRAELEAYAALEISFDSLTVAAKQFLYHNLFDVNNLLEQGLAIDYKFKSLERVQKRVLENETEQDSSSKTTQS